MDKGFYDSNRHSPNDYLNESMNNVTRTQVNDDEENSLYNLILKNFRLLQVVKNTYIYGINYNPRYQHYCLEYALTLAAFSSASYCFNEIKC